MVNPVFGQLPGPPPQRVQYEQMPIQQSETGSGFSEQLGAGNVEEALASRVGRNVKNVSKLSYLACIGQDEYKKNRRILIFALVLICLAVIGALALVADTKAEIFTPLMRGLLLGGVIAVLIAAVAFTGGAVHSQNKKKLTRKEAHWDDNAPKYREFLNPNAQ